MALTSCGLDAGSAAGRRRVGAICLLAILVSALVLVTESLSSETAALFLPAPEELRMSHGRSALFLPRPDSSRALIFLHSGGGSARSALEGSGFVAAAQRAGFSLAFGESRDGLWRYDGLRGVEAPVDETRLDEAYLLELRETLLARGYGSEGVFLAGYSNGGMAALQAACGHPGLFQGVALISSAMPEAVGASCEALPARVIAVNGDADPVVPIRGGEGVNPQIGPVWGLDRLGDALLRRRGCVGFDRLRIDETSLAAPAVLRLRAAACERPGVTDLYRVAGGGHDGYGDENWKLRVFGAGGAFFAPELILRAFAAPAAED
jgi:polyhydroxybutyrate depolymerase